MDKARDRGLSRKETNGLVYNVDSMMYCGYRTLYNLASLALKYNTIDSGQAIHEIFWFTSFRNVLDVSIQNYITSYPCAINQDI